MAATMVLTLLEGGEAGLVGAVALSIFLHLYSASRPHIAKNAGAFIRRQIPSFGAKVSCIVATERALSSGLLRCWGAAESHQATEFNHQSRCCRRAGAKLRRYCCLPNVLVEVDSRPFGASPPALHCADPWSSRGPDAINP